MSMNTIDCFKLIYTLPYEESEKTISIHEEKADAKIHCLNVIGDNIIFTKFDESLSRSIGNLFSSKTYCKKTADGVIFYQKDGINHLLICELKSSKIGVCDTAFEQAAATYIKTVMVLSICEGFTLENTNIIFVFTAKEDASLLLEFTELQDSDQSSLSPMEKKRLALFKNKSTTIRLPEIPNKREAFCTRLQEKEIKCLLLMSKDSDTIELDVNNFT